MRGQAILFEEVSFQINNGGILVLRGPNGSGKSSLLRAIAGFLPLAAGQISCNGQMFDPGSDEAGLTSLWYSQADGLAGPLSVAQNLSLGRTGGSVEAIRNKLAEDDPFGVASLLDQQVRNLSSGQRQRAALTRLCFTPSPSCLWLLDEPNSALDEAGHQALEDVLSQHQEAGGLCIIASHHHISDRLHPTELNLGEV